MIEGAGPTKVSERLKKLISERLAKGRQRLEKQVKTGSMTQEKEDGKLSQLGTRLGVGSLPRNFACGSPCLEAGEEDGRDLAEAGARQLGFSGQ